MMRTLAAAVLVTLCCGAVVGGQGAAVRWEAVSIRPVSEPPRGQGPQGANVFSRPYTTVHQLLTYAYEVPAYAVIGGPSWSNTDRYAVLGRTDAPPAPGEMRLLVQQLLADRFRIEVRRETREMAAYDLVFARGDRRLGPNLKPASVDCLPFLTGQRPQSESPVIEVPGVGLKPTCGNGVTFNMASGVLTPQLNGITMERFTSFIQGRMNRPIQNQTRLSGVFDVELTFVEETMPRFGGVERTPAPEGLSFSTALIDQLGLKLQPTKAVVEVLVIDHVERPTEN